MIWFIAGVVVTLTVQQLWRRWEYPRRTDTELSWFLWTVRPRWWLAVALGVTLPSLVFAAEHSDRREQIRAEGREIIDHNRARFEAEHAREIYRLTRPAAAESEEPRHA